MPDLRSRSVLVTRPAGQSRPLEDAIRDAGGVPVSLPALEISARDSGDIAAELDKLPAADISLFVSPNAVAFGIDYATGRVGAIGPGTANAIREQGRSVDIVPQGGFNSEHLLMHDAFADIDGKAIRIIRGQSGRELLGSTLAHRGARVDYLSVYERRCPTHPEDRINKVLDNWVQDGFAAWTILSVETLDNFLAIVGEKGATLAAATPLVTPAERVLKEAEERLPGVFVALSHGTSAEEIVDAVDAVMVPDPA